jgi:glycosyltransferase involved in cell wall biosynthesis
MNSYFKKRIKILYDITVLGIGHHRTRARTGIFRVVENIAIQLKSNQQCKIYFWSGRKPIDVLRTIDYLKNSKELNNVSFMFSPHLIINYLFNLLFFIYKKVNFFKIDVLTRKIISKFIYRFWKLFSKIYYDVDIFHSTFLELPNNKYIPDYIKRFITIYDLIPVLFPQYFEFKEDHLIKKIIASIQLNDSILCISKSTKNDLCNFKKELNQNNIKVTHLAASELFYKCSDTEKIFFVRKKYKIPNFPYVLSLSTLEPRKNINFIIRSFANFLKNYKINDLYLVLTGTKGWDYDQIFEEFSQYKDFKNKIIFTGFVDDIDLAPLYSDALVFVYLSLYEGFGLPPLEAMKCGCPVITSNNSSLPEVIGNAGIMMNATDTESLCKSIYNIYQDPKYREMLSTKSLQQASNFSWEKCVNETIKAYSESLSGQSPSKYIITN